MGNKTEDTPLALWATDILLEAHVIAPCPDHGFMRLHHSQQAVDYALSLAEHRKFSGKNRDQRRFAVENILDSLADECPACD
jgi:hypothetical protein